MPNAILDPTGTVTSSAKPAAPRAPRLASLQGKRGPPLTNTKMNARPFLEEVGRLLQERYDVTLTERTKVNFAVPEPEDVIKELVAGNDVVITGVGDCGSCSAAPGAPGGRAHRGQGQGAGGAGARRRRGTARRPRERRGMTAADTEGAAGTV